MLPQECIDRLLVEGDILALKMLEEQNTKLFHMLVKTVEGPNDLDDFSLGSATAQESTGTDWNEIQDGADRYLLEPEFQNTIFHIFYGIYPSYAWVYRRFPANVDRGSLRGTRTIGDRTYRVGKIDGLKSPYDAPSARTEFFTVQGTHPAFLGYHPYLEPSSVAIRMNFSVVRYGVQFLETPSPEQQAKAIIRTMAGASLLQVPQWLRKEGG